MLGVSSSPRLSTDTSPRTPGSRRRRTILPEGPSIKYEEKSVDHRREIETIFATKVPSYEEILKRSRDFLVERSQRQSLSHNVDTTLSGTALGGARRATYGRRLTITSRPILFHSKTAENAEFEYSDSSDEETEDEIRNQDEAHNQDKIRNQDVAHNQDKIHNQDKTHHQDKTQNGARDAHNEQGTVLQPMASVTIEQNQSTESPVDSSIPDIGKVHLHSPKRPAVVQVSSPSRKRRSGSPEPQKGAKELLIERIRARGSRITARMYPNLSDISEMSVSLTDSSDLDSQDDNRSDGSAETIIAEHSERTNGVNTGGELEKVSEPNEVSMQDARGYLEEDVNHGFGPIMGDDDDDNEPMPFDDEGTEQPQFEEQSEQAKGLNSREPTSSGEDSDLAQIEEQLQQIKGLEGKGPTPSGNVLPRMEHVERISPVVTNEEIEAQNELTLIEEEQDEDTNVTLPLGLKANYHYREEPVKPRKKLPLPKSELGNERIFQRAALKHVLHDVLGENVKGPVLAAYNEVLNAYFYQTARRLVAAHQASTREEQQDSDGSSPWIHNHEIAQMIQERHNMSIVELFQQALKKLPEEGATEILKSGVLARQ